MRYAHIIISFNKEISELFIEEKKWEKVSYYNLSKLCPWLPPAHWWIRNSLSYFENELVHVEINNGFTYANFSDSDILITTETLKMADNSFTCEIIGE